MIKIEMPVPFALLVELTEGYMIRFLRRYPEEKEENIYSENHCRIMLHDSDTKFVDESYIPQSGEANIWKLVNNESLLTIEFFFESLFYKNWNIPEEIINFEVDLSDISKFIDGEESKVQKYISTFYGMFSNFYEDGEDARKVISNFIRYLFKQPVISHLAFKDVRVKKRNKLQEPENENLIPDINYDRELIRMLKLKKSAIEIARQIGVTEKTILNRESELRKRYGKKMVPYRQNWKNRDS